jgi:flagellar motor switch protein FliN/FliY
VRLEEKRSIEDVAETRGAREPRLPEFPEGERRSGAGDDRELELLQNVTVRVRVELGRARMRAREILELKEGSVVELDREPGEALDIYVNDRIVARGEVLVLDGKFCVRVTEVLAPEECFRVKQQA